MLSNFVPKYFNVSRQIYNENAYFEKYIEESLLDNDTKNEYIDFIHKYVQRVTAASRDMNNENIIVPIGNKVYKAFLPSFMGAGLNRNMFCFEFTLKNIIGESTAKYVHFKLLEVIADLILRK